MAYDPTLVVVNGFPRAGKDETVKQTVLHLEKLGVYSAQFSSIDPFLKAVTALGLDPSKPMSPEIRALLSEWKASADKHFNFSTKQVAAQARATFFGENPRFMPVMCAFTFIREPHNIDKLKEELKDDKINVLTLLVKGNRSERVDSNTSDMHVEDYAYDVIVNNNGTLEELAEGCFDFASRLARKPSARSAKVKMTPEEFESESWTHGDGGV